MKGHYLFNTNEWDGAVAEIHIDESKLDSRDWYTNNFLKGYHLFKLGKSDELAGLIKTFDAKLIKSRQVQNASQDVAVCGLPESTPMELKSAERYMSELKGLQGWLERDPVTLLDNIAEDYLADLRIPLVSARKPARGRVHRGVRNALDEIWEPLSELVARLRSVLSDHPGPTPVVLHLTSGNGTPTRLRLTDELCVRPQPDRGNILNLESTASESAHAIRTSYRQRFSTIDTPTLASETYSRSTSS